MMNNNPPDTWNEWSKFVLRELERLNVCYERINVRVDEINSEIIRLKVKSGIWGLIGGAIPVVVATLWILLGRK